MEAFVNKVLFLVPLGCIFLVAAKANFTTKTFDGLFFHRFPREIRRENRMDQYSTDEEPRTPRNMVFLRNRPSGPLHGLYRKGFSYLHVPDYHRRPLEEARLPPPKLNQSLDDIISGIIHLLGGEVQVTTTSLPPPIKPARVNNRGPTHFDETKTNPRNESSPSDPITNSSRWTFPGEKDVSMILGLLNETSTTTIPLNEILPTLISTSSPYTGLVEISPQINTTTTTNYFVETNAEISLTIKSSSVTKSSTLPESLIEIQPSITIFSAESQPPELIKSSSPTPTLEIIIPSTTLKIITPATTLKIITPTTTSRSTTIYTTIPTGPVTDWLPAGKPNYNVIFSANTRKNFDEPVIITQPPNAPFEMTVTQQMGPSVIGTENIPTNRESSTETTELIPAIVSTQVDIVYGRPITALPSSEQPGRPHVFTVDISQVRPSKGAGMRPWPRPHTGPMRLPIPPPPLVTRPIGPPVIPPSSGPRPAPLPPRKPSSYRPPNLDVPEVRIDTCLVGDDSTCETQLNEHCRTERGVSSCLCRPGFGRAEQRGLCSPVVSMLLTLKVAKLGERAIDATQLIPGSQDYKRLFLEASQAMSTVFSYSPLSEAFRGALVNRVGFIANRMVINSTVHLSEADVRGSLRHHMEHAVASAINRQRNRVGESQLFVQGPLSALVEVEDLNECDSNEMNDCSDHAFCENLFGSFQCSCAPGYTDKSPAEIRTAGRICSACSPDYCNGRGKCIVVNGQQECKCRGNFGGARCQVDNEVVGVSVGVSIVALIVIAITAVCLYLWNRRWKQAQQKSDAAKHLGYRLQTMADHVRWGSPTATTMANTYVPSESTLRLTPSHMTASATQLYTLPTVQLSQNRQERRVVYEDDLNPYGRIIRTLQKSSNCQPIGMQYDTLNSECASSEELGFPSIPSNSFVYHGSFPDRKQYR